MPHRYSLRSAIAALPDLGLAGFFLYVWVAPHAAGPGRIGDLMLIVLLEFIVVHSAAFMGTTTLQRSSRRTRVVVILKFGVFYTLFVGGFALGFHTWWPVFAFWGLTLNRMLGVIVGQAPTGEEQRLIKAGWAVGVMSYLVAVFASTFLPVPRLGITPEVIGAANLPGTGLWVDQPYRVLAAGMLYFTAVGISALRDHRWIKSTSLRGRSHEADE